MVYKPLSGEALEKRKAYQRAYREKHKEEINRRRRENRHSQGEFFREKQREYYQQNKDKINAWLREYYQKNKKKIQERQKKIRHNNKDKNNARTKKNRREKYGISTHKIVSNAIKRGELVKQPCEECGSMEVQAHHDNYNKPLEVRWLCDTCHKKWHQNNKPIYIKKEDKNEH